MEFAIGLVVVVLWVTAILACCNERLPWETNREWRARRRAELRRKITK